MLRITADFEDPGRTEEIRNDCSGRKDQSLERPQSEPWDQVDRGGGWAGRVLSNLFSRFLSFGLLASLLSLLLLPPLLLSQGLQDECQYLLQPQLIVRRLLDVAVLVPGRPSEQTLFPHNRSALYK